MPLLIPCIKSARGGGFLLALVSESFAYGLSRVVEAICGFMRYKGGARKRAQSWCEAIAQETNR